MGVSDEVNRHVGLVNALCDGGRMTLEEAQAKVSAFREDGLRDGMRQMAEAACRAVCFECQNGGISQPDSAEIYWHGHIYCPAGPIRRAAVQLGLSLDAKEGKNP